MSKMFQLMLGRVVTNFGQSLGSSVLTMWFAFEVSSVIGASWVQSIPPILGLLLFTIVGVTVDRFSHKQVLVLCDILSTVSLIGISIGMKVASTDYSVGVGIIFCFFIVYQILQLFFNPAADSMLSQIMDNQNRAKSYSIYRGFSQVSTLLGQAISGSLIGLLGSVVVILINATLHFFSGLFECLLPDTKSQSHAFKQLSFWLSSLEGIKFIFRKPDTLRLSFLALIVNGLITPAFLVLPFYLKNTLGIPVEQYGFILATYSGGQILGSLWLSPWMSRFNYAKGISLSLAMISSSLLMLALSKWIIVVFAVIFCLGLFQAPVGVLVMSQIHSSTPKEFIGRVMSALMAFSQCIMPILSLFTAQLINLKLMDNQTALVFSGAGILLVAGWMLTGSKNKS